MKQNFQRDTMGNFTKWTICLLAVSSFIPSVKPECPPDAVMDLVFLIDTSSSIRKAGQEAIDSIRSFIYAVIDGFTIGPNHTQFGAISFNRDPQIEFMLDEHGTTMDTKAGIDLVSFQEGRGTETGKALRFMADVLDAGFGARNSSKVVAIVITDGRSSEKRDFVYESAERLKEVVDIVIAVGVNMKKENELSREIKDIASDPDEHYAIEADSYDSLSKIKDIVKQCICMGISKQHCFLPMLSADDAGMLIDPRSRLQTTARPRPRGGNGAGKSVPIAGPDQKPTSFPAHIESDACCGQNTYNTGMKRCCAVGKKDSDKFLVDFDDQCPAESVDVVWDSNFFMDYNIDVSHMMPMGLDQNFGLDMDYMGPEPVFEPIPNFDF